MNAPILVAGAGPGGLALAVALHRRGIPVEVYERAPELRVAGAGFVMQPNAMRMLATLGVDEAIAAAGVRVVGGTVATATGTVLQGMVPGPEIVGDQPAIAVHRGAVATILARALPDTALRFGAGVLDVAQDEQGVTVTLSDGTEARGAAAIGCDGIHSQVRRATFGDLPLRYSGYTCWRGVAPCTSGLEPGHVTERWGRGRRLGIVPIGPERTYWYATANAPEGGRDEEDPRADLRDRFAEFGTLWQRLLEQTPADAILRNDIHDLPPLPRWTEGRVALLGDAAHAMTPNMGQGACQAIEDAVWLAHALADSREHVPTALRAYEASRIRRARSIAAQSWRIGVLAQWENALLRSVRDTLMRLTPKSLLDASLRDVFGAQPPAS